MRLVPASQVCCFLVGHIIDRPDIIYLLGRSHTYTHALEGSRELNQNKNFTV